MENTEIAEILTEALVVKHQASDIWGSREESTGAIIVVTGFGNKVRITTDGEVEVLVGPGLSETEVHTPPEFSTPAAEPTDLPPLIGTPAPGDVPEGGEEEGPITKAYLLERAAELDISGRSSMTKDELAAAIEAAEQE